MFTTQTPREKNRSPFGLTNQATPSCRRIEKGFPTAEVLGEGNEMSEGPSSRLVPRLAAALSRRSAARLEENASTEVTTLSTRRLPLFIDAQSIQRSSAGEDNEAALR